jgi:hypothetical protein
MARKFSTQPVTMAGRKLADEIARHGRQAVAAQLGIHASRLSHIVAGARVATPAEVLATARAGIATLADWCEPCVCTPAPPTPTPRR